jgi:hypothetical protein
MNVIGKLVTVTVDQDDYYGVVLNRRQEPYVYADTTSKIPIFVLDILWCIDQGDRKDKFVMISLNVKPYSRYAKSSVLNCHTVGSRTENTVTFLS